MFDFLLGLTATEVSMFSRLTPFAFAFLGLMILSKYSDFNLVVGFFTTLLICIMAAGLIPRNKINDYLGSQNSYLKIQNDHLYKVDKKEIALSDEVKMNKSESTLLGKLNCGNLVLRDCLDLLVKNQDLISAQGSDSSSIDVASFK